jgi:hypothetical protein
MSYQYFPNVLGSLQTNFDDFRSNLTNVSRVFWGDPRLFPITFGATISMFLEVLGGPQTISNDFQSNYANVSQRFWEVPRLFPMTSKATISKLLEYFGGSPDCFQWLPEQLHQCFPSVLVGLVTISDVFSWKYTSVAQVFWGAGGTSIAHCHLFGKDFSKMPHKS